MGLKKKLQVMLFPVTLAAGIVTGIAIERTKRKAAHIAAVGEAAAQELPVGETCKEQGEEEMSGNTEEEKPAVEPENAE